MRFGILLAIWAVLVSVPMFAAAVQCQVGKTRNCFVLLACSLALLIGGAMCYQPPILGCTVIRKSAKGGVEICPEGTWKFGYQVSIVPRGPAIALQGRIATEPVRTSESAQRPR